MTDSIKYCCSLSCELHTNIWYEIVWNKNVLFITIIDYVQFAVLMNFLVCSTPFTVTLLMFANIAWNLLMKDSKWHLSSNESQTRYAWLPIVDFNGDHN